MREINLFLCCWGEYAEYSKRFLLPSLLQKGNLPAIVNKNVVSLHFYCEVDKVDTKSILRAFAGIALQIKFVDVNKVANFDRHDQSIHKYNLMTACHKNFIKSITCGSYAVFLHPDFILSENTFSHLEQKIEIEKCEVYFTHILRVSMVGSASVEEERAKQGDSSFYNVTSLTKFGIENLLPLAKLYNINADESSAWPIEFHTYGEAGLSLYSFGMHPLLYRKKKEVEFDCFDGDLVEKSYLTHDSKIQFYRNNASFIILELNRPSMFIGKKLMSRASAVYTAAVYAKYLPQKIRNRYIESKIIYKAKGFDNKKLINRHHLDFFKIKVMFFLWLFKKLKINTNFLIRHFIGEKMPYEITS